MSGRLNRDDNFVAVSGGQDSTDATKVEPHRVNPSTGRLLVDASGTGGGTEYTEGDVDATFSGPVLLAEGPSNTATPLQVDASKNLKTIAAANSGVNIGTVDVASSALPTGAATSAKQDTLLAELQLKADLTETQPVSAASLPLPSGAATAAKQDTLLTELQLKADLTETQPVSLASVPSHAVTNAGTFVVQENGAALTALQLIDDVVYTDDTSTHSTGSSKGALLMAAATPTDGSVNANDIGAIAMTTDRKLHTSVQDPLPAGTNNIGDVDVLSSALPTGAATLAEQQTQTASLSVLDDWDESDRAKVNPIVGQAGVAAGSGAVGVTTQRVILATDDPAVTSLALIDDIVKTEDAAHASGDKGVMAFAVRTDIAGSALAGNGDYSPLQVTSGGYLRVDLDNIGAGGLVRTNSSSTTSVSDSATNVILLGANSTRVGASFFNDSTEIAYLKEGITASTTDFTVKMQPGAFYELAQPCWLGQIDCIWANNASGAMRITERG